MNIYGNSTEDRYFENQLLNYLDSEVDFSGKLIKETINFFVDKYEYFVEFSAEFRSGEIDSLEIHFAEKAGEFDESWTKVPRSDYEELEVDLRKEKGRILEEMC